jgi:hypothetical protein
MSYFVVLKIHGLSRFWMRGAPDSSDQLVGSQILLLPT